jgi:hypothetical protein
VEGDAGEFLCALKVFYRLSRPDLIEAAIADAGAIEGPKAAAIADALMHEQPNGMADLVRRLASSHKELLPHLAVVIGHRRLPLADILLDSLLDEPSILWALGRLRESRAIEPFRRLARTGKGSIRRTAVLALLRLENRLDPDYCSPLVLGLMGADHRMAEMAANSDPDSSLGLGLLGSSAAVPILIGRLPQPEAAIGLQLLTGADLFHEQALEGEALEPGERPVTITKFSSDVDVWQQWWKRNENRFVGQMAFRSGIRYGTENLLRCLLDPARTHIERHWTAEQLAVRHGMALSFEVDMLVSTQRAILVGSLAGSSE